MEMNKGDKTMVGLLKVLNLVHNRIHKNWFSRIYAPACFTLALAFSAVLAPTASAGANTTLTYQAEKMIGSGSITADTTADQGKALLLTTGTAATGTFTLAEANSKILVKAKGISCDGAPIMKVSIDGSVKLTATVTATAWAYSTANTPIAAGTHTFAVTFTNPYGTASCTRQLFSDVIYLEKSPAPPADAMPVGNLPGWTQIFSDDFTTAAPLGSFSTAYTAKWSTYSGPDTAGKKYAAKRSEYKTAKVVSVSGGILDEYLHAETDPSGYAGSAKYMMSAALLPKNVSQTYGRYTVRLKADSIQGYKIAWMLWPNSGTNITGAVGGGGNGEIDFAEGNLDSYMRGFIHHQNATVGSDQDVCTPNPSVYLYSGWHIVTLEWAPSSVKMIMDGTTICESNIRIPNTTMHPVLQTESTLTATPYATSGHLQLDWISIYSRN